MFKFIVGCCAIISTLCLLYFVVANESVGCLAYPKSSFCQMIMSILPDTPEETVVKQFKENQKEKSATEGTSENARRALKKLIEVPAQR